jgi:LysM repeat protein
MIAGAMAMVGWRNPARYLAPLALAAAGVTTYAIVHNALKHKHATPPALVAPRTSTTQSQATHTKSHSKAKFYVVRSNDTLSKIAARTGVSLGTIEQLNPSVTPNALHPGQRLRLR